MEQTSFVISCSIVHVFCLKYESTIHRCLGHPLLESIVNRSVALRSHLGEKEHVYTTQLGLSQAPEDWSNLGPRSGKHDGGRETHET